MMVEMVNLAKGSLLVLRWAIAPIAAKCELLLRFAGLSWASEKRFRHGDCSYLSGARQATALLESKKLIIQFGVVRNAVEDQRPII